MRNGGFGFVFVLAAKMVLAILLVLSGLKAYAYQELPAKAAAHAPSLAHEISSLDVPRLDARAEAG